jgi:hypothetical protein
LLRAGGGRCPASANHTNSAAGRSHERPWCLPRDSAGAGRPTTFRSRWCRRQGAIDHALDRRRSQCRRGGQRAILPIG